MAKDILGGIAVGGHPRGAALVHAYPVAEPGTGEDKEGGEPVGAQFWLDDKQVAS